MGVVHCELIWWRKPENPRRTTDPAHAYTRFEIVQQRWQTSNLPVRCPICYVTCFLNIIYTTLPTASQQRFDTAAHEFILVIQIDIDKRTCDQRTEENCRNGRREKLLSLPQAHLPSSQSPYHKTDDDDDHRFPISDFYLFFIRQYKENIWLTKRAALSQKVATQLYLLNT